MSKRRQLQTEHRERSADFGLKSGGVGGSPTADPSEIDPMQICCYIRQGDSDSGYVQCCHEAGQGDARKDDPEAPSWHCRCDSQRNRFD